MLDEDLNVIGSINGCAGGRDALIAGYIDEAPGYQPPVLARADLRLNHGWAWQGDGRIGRLGETPFSKRVREGCVVSEFRPAWLSGTWLKRRGRQKVQHRAEQVWCGMRVIW